MDGYSARDVATIIGVSASRVRSLASSILDVPRGPRGELRFSFQDLVLLRAARSLLESGVSSRRLRKAIERLRDQLPPDRKLSQVRIAAVGERVIVHDGDSVWNPESGQAMFDFSVNELASGVADLVRRSSPARQMQKDADEWFDAAWDLERSSSSEAEAAYHRVLELDSRHADAHLNLGRLLHESGRHEDAERHYRLACEAAPDDATGWFNLGVLFEDTGRLAEAAEAYAKAIDIDPYSADAHYNLGGVYERIGRPQEAIRHLAQFRRLAERED